MRRLATWPRLFAALLAILAIAATSPLAAVLAVSPTTHTPPAVVAPAPAVAAAEPGDPSDPPDPVAWQLAAASARDATVTAGAPSSLTAHPPIRPAAARATVARTTAKTASSPAHVASRPTPKSTPTATYRGRNHLWIPALGMDRSVAFYACGTPSAPGLGVYRWGCAGANNVYLLAHAYAAFKPLHDAYVSGRLRKGMKVLYADGSGRVHTYTVAWWRLTTPDNGAFAFAAQSRPSMTLQTCVGAQSQYRLIVRLFQVD